MATGTFPRSIPLFFCCKKDSKWKIIKQKLSGSSLAINFGNCLQALGVPELMAGETWQFLQLKADFFLFLRVAKLNVTWTSSLEFHVTFCFLTYLLISFLSQTSVHIWPLPSDNVMSLTFQPLSCSQEMTGYVSTPENGHSGDFQQPARVFVNVKLRQRERRHPMFFERWIYFPHTFTSVLTWVCFSTTWIGMQFEREFRTLSRHESQTTNNASKHWNTSARCFSYCLRRRPTFRLVRFRESRSCEAACRNEWNERRLFHADEHLFSESTQTRTLLLNNWKFRHHPVFFFFLEQKRQNEVSYHCPFPWSRHFDTPNADNG